MWGGSGVEVSRNRYPFFHPTFETVHVLPRLSTLSGEVLRGSSAMLGALKVPLKYANLFV